MGLKFSSFAKNGFDISTFNGTIDWKKVNCDYVGIRCGFGIVPDNKFVENVEAAKQVPNLDIFAYLYGDYYSNWVNKKSAVYGISDEEWGRKQADFIYAMIKDRPRIKAVLLDVENTTVKKYPKLSETEAKKHAIVIYRAILERLDELKVKNGIYASLGWLSWFPVWFRNRALWVAFYPYRTANVTVEDVIYMCAKNGWEVAPIMWQYASDGDVDDNGTADGIEMGMQYKFLDLNGWIGTEDQYSALFGAPVVVVETPDDEAEVIPQPEFETWLLTGSLFIRESGEGSKQIGVLFKGYEPILDVSGNDWKKIHGQPGYINTVRYAERK